MVPPPSQACPEGRQPKCPQTLMCKLVAGSPPSPDLPFGSLRRYPLRMAKQGSLDTTKTGMFKLLILMGMALIQSADLPVGPMNTVPRSSKSKVLDAAL